MILVCIISYHMLSNEHLASTMDHMPQKPPSDHQGTLNIRGIPKETIFRLKMAAAAEHRTVKGFILAVTEERIQALERKGVLPKAKKD